MQFGFFFNCTEVAYALVVWHQLDQPLLVQFDLLLQWYTCSRRAFFLEELLRWGLVSIYPIRSHPCRLCGDLVFFAFYVATRGHQ